MLERLCSDLLGHQGLRGHRPSEKNDSRINELWNSPGVLVGRLEQGFQPYNHFEEFQMLLSYT